MRAKMISLTLCVLSLSLFACLRVPSTSPDSLTQVFTDLEIDDERLLINQVADGKDRMECIDLSNKNAVRIHIIDPYMQNPEAANRQIMFTPGWIYDTATMEKHPNTYDLSSKAETETLIKQYTTLYEPGRFTNEQVVFLARGLESPSTHRSGALHMLKGEDPSVSDPPEGANAMVEIRYRERELMEIHFTLEHDVPSTKQESNYISGTHWYFGLEMIDEFPDLSSFSQPND